VLRQGKLSEPDDSAGGFVLPRAELILDACLNTV
jgi:hypothetical protein